MPEGRPLTCSGGCSSILYRLLFVLPFVFAFAFILVHAVFTETHLCCFVHVVCAVRSRGVLMWCVCIVGLLFFRRWDVASVDALDG